MQATTQARANKKARISELRRKLAGLTEAERKAFTDRGIIATVEGRTLSVNNTMMVYLQCNGNTPSVVGGYKQWIKAGRRVMKGQHGYSILFPVGQKDKETGEITGATHFYSGTIFDIGQTESIGTPATPEPEPQSQPMPAPQPVNKMKEWALV
ncbi:hypothetical protein LCGC14_1146960 [marine sediment metagenome]|uniref:N-terminal domain-containing protein n=1 Tax=marine sediment metagenome TaxID=412755 RepID=A0A0F9Q2A2_9ZZZZ